MAFSTSAQETGYASAARFIAEDPNTRVLFDAVGCAPHAEGLLEGDTEHKLHLGVCPVLPKDIDNTLLSCCCWHEALHIKYSCGLKKEDFPQGSLHTIMNGLEDNRIERLGAEDYAGVGPQMRDASIYYNKKIGNQISKGEVNAPLWEAICAMDLMQRGLSISWIPTSKAQKYIDAAYETYCEIGVITRKDGIYAVLELAKKIQKILIDVNKNLEKEEKKENGGSGKSKKGKSKKGKSEKGDSKPSMAGDIEDEQDETESEDGENESEGKSENDSEEKSKSSSKTKNKEADEKAKANLDEESKGGKDKKDSICEDVQKKLDELSPTEREYTADRRFDKIEKVEKRNGDEEEYRKAVKEISGKISVMGTVIEQALRAAAKTRVRSCREVGLLDENNLAAAARGLTKAVFKDSVEGAKLNTVVSFVIDESGSMMAEERVEKTRLMVIALAEVMSRFGIPFEVLGSTTTEEYSESEYKKSGFTRSNPLWMRIYKGFDENWTNVKSKIMQTSARANNIDGEWVAFAGRRIANRKERRKIVFSLSDGSPVSGHGCKIDQIMKKNVQTVCERLRKSGIEVYGFGIQTDAPKSLYGEKCFVGLESISEMGNKFVRTFADILSKGAIKF